MSKTPFMPLWVSDFLGDTLDLDATEIGTYMLLLMAQWNRDGGSLPDDEAKLRRVARCGRNWPKVWGNVERFFNRDEDGVFNPRLRLEAQSVAAKRLVNAHNGSLGGSAKVLKTKDVDLANANDPLQRKPTIPEPEPETEQEKKEKEEANASSKKSKGSRLPDGWFLPVEYGEWAVEQEWSIPVIRLEADKFKDYWHSVAGAKAAKRDWFATWRNWMRNSNSPKAINGGLNEQSNHGTKNDQLGGLTQAEQRSNATLANISRLAQLR